MAFSKVGNAGEVRQDAVPTYRDKTAMNGVPRAGGGERHTYEPRIVSINPYLKNRDARLQDGEKPSPSISFHCEVNTPGKTLRGSLQGPIAVMQDRSICQSICRLASGTDVSSLTFRLNTGDGTELLV